MLIYKCDRCGHREEFTDGIAHNQFAAVSAEKKYKSRRKFRTLREDHQRIRAITESGDG